MPIRGGNWDNGSNAGVAALNLNNPRSNSNWNIGFRPALLKCQILKTYWVLSQCIKKRSPIPSISWKIYTEISGK